MRGPLEIATAKINWLLLSTNPGYSRNLTHTRSYNHTIPEPVRTVIIYHSTNRYPPTIECLHHVWNGRLVVRDWLLVKCRTASTCGSCAAVAVGFCSIATCVPIGHGLRGKPSGLGNYRDRRAHRIATPWPAPIKIRSAQPPAVSIGARLRVFGYVTSPAGNPGAGPAAWDCGPQCISPYRNWLLPACTFPQKHLYIFLIHKKQTINKA